MCLKPYPEPTVSEAKGQQISSPGQTIPSGHRHNSRQLLPTGRDQLPVSNLIELNFPENSTQD